MARTNRIGFYREIAEYQELIDKNIIGRIENPIHSTTKIDFNFKFVNGDGLTKVEFQLFRGWIEESGNYAIETNANINFKKGDYIFIEGVRNAINKTIERIDTSTRLRGNKKDDRKIRLIFCG